MLGVQRPLLRQRSRPWALLIETEEGHPWEYERWGHQWIGWEHQSGREQQEVWKQKDAPLKVSLLVRVQQVGNRAETGRVHVGSEKDQ